MSSTARPSPARSPTPTGQGASLRRHSTSRPWTSSPTTTSSRISGSKSSSSWPSWTINACQGRRGPILIGSAVHREVWTLLKPAKSKPLTGAYYWFPRPQPDGPTWELAHLPRPGRLGRYLPHREFWPHIVEHLATAWGLEAGPSSIVSPTTTPASRVAGSTTLGPATSFSTVGIPCGRRCLSDH